MEIIQRPQIDTRTINDSVAEFTITPLEPGFGYTVGNSLRRTLLSSIPGAAITSIKVDGVSHEFQAVDGVKEDMVQIIQNIKNIVFSSVIDEPVTLFINAKKAGLITAADINLSSGVRVFNPEQPICTLAKGTLSMELVVERGRGYVPAATNKRLSAANNEVGRIAVDSIYSPVLNVSYDVKATRVGEHTNFDSLSITVTTKSSISPIDAMASAGKTLTELFGLVNHLNINAEGLNVPAENAGLQGFLSGSSSVIDEESVNNQLDANPELISIQDMAFSDTIRTVLERNGISTLAQLLKYSEDDLNNLDKVGPAKIKQIKDVLSADNYKLADNVK